MAEPEIFPPGVALIPYGQPDSGDWLAEGIAQVLQDTDPDDIVPPAGDDRTTYFLLDELDRLWREAA